MALTRDFPLFPLRLVALPGELIPLHVFEERYKALVERCLEEPSEFGIVCADEDGLRSVGCACGIAEVLERFDDGRINLVARATRPFRIEAEQGDLPYPAGAVEFLADDADNADPGADLLAAVHGAYAELVRQATDRTPDEAEIAAMSAYDMAGTVEFAIAAKQQMLEARSEVARLEQLLRLLRGAVRRLDFMERAQAVARSNGKVSLGPGDPPIPPPDEL
jgi:Lon protease-like protein